MSCSMIPVLELTLLDLERSLLILSLDPECLLDLDLPLLESLLPEPDLVRDLEVEEGILGSFLLEIEKKIIIKTWFQMSIVKTILLKPGNHIHYSRYYHNSHYRNLLDENI